MIYGSTCGKDEILHDKNRHHILNGCCEAWRRGRHLGTATSLGAKIEAGTARRHDKAMVEHTCVRCLIPYISCLLEIVQNEKPLFAHF